jgi:hypothetical protein
LKKSTGIIDNHLRGSIEGRFSKIPITGRKQYAGFQKEMLSSNIKGDKIGKS